MLLAQLSSIHPVICVADHGVKHVESLMDKSKGDMVLDYCSGTIVLSKGSGRLQNKRVGQSTRLMLLARKGATSISAMCSRGKGDTSHCCFPEMTIPRFHRRLGIL